MIILYCSKWTNKYRLSDSKKDAPTNFKKNIQECVSRIYNDFFLLNLICAGCSLYNYVYDTIVLSQSIATRLGYRLQMTTKRDWGLQLCINYIRWNENRCKEFTCLMHFILLIISTILFFSSGLNFQDLMARQGVIESLPKAPFILGFECSGVIEQVAEGVEKFKVSNFCGKQRVHNNIIYNYSNI